MDDRHTREIPSLKEFEEGRQDREAMSRRSGSMQTKRELGKNRNKSDSGQKKSGSKGLFGKKKKKSHPKDKIRDSKSRRPEPRSVDMSATRKYGINADDERLVRARYSDRSEMQNEPGREQRQGRGQSGVGAQRTSYARMQASHTAATHDKKRMPAPDTYARYRNARNTRTDAVSRDNAMRNDGSCTRRPVGDARKGGTRNTNNSHEEYRKAKRPQKSRKPQRPKKPLSPAARKFRNICAYAAIIVVVLAVGVVLSLTVLFKAESINVSGNGKYSAQDIIDVSGLILGDNIFTAPKSRAAANIEKRYPAIERADVYCVFPNAINIDITMAKPAYAIEALGGCYILSDKCKVLEVVSTVDEIEIPVIEGVSIEGKAAGEYVEFNDEFISGSLEEMFSAFSDNSGDKVTAVNFSRSNDGTASLRFVYDNRIVVYLGIPEHITYKVQTALTIIKEKIDVNTARLAGDLDVSLCYDTNKSYFNQYSLISPPVIAATTAATEPQEDETSATVVYDY